MNRTLLVASTFLMLASSAAFAEAPKVVASFKPVHSLVASVMEGVGNPFLLVKGSASPHTYALTPSDAGALQGAEAIFWIGHDMETFLEKPLQALGGTAKVVALGENDDLTLHYMRGGGPFEDHVDEQDEDGAKEAAESEHGHQHGAIDPHVWLDPENAKAIVREIAKSLSGIDPVNATVYEDNADETIAELDALTNELAAALTPVKGRPFITFHDAFQYFEKRFEVEAAGAVTINPEIASGAERIASLQAKVRELGAVCLFTEPNFDSKVMKVVMEGTKAKTATLDPEASSVPEGPGLYVQSLREIAWNMAECLAE